MRRPPGLVALCAATWLLPGIAWACSTFDDVLQCPRTAPGHDVDLPANAPGFLVESSCLLVDAHGELVCDEIEEPPELLGPDGEPWPASVEFVHWRWILRPSPLEVGRTYTLVPHPLAGACAPGSPGGGPVRIRAVEPRRLPRSLGRLELLQVEEARIRTWTDDGSCYRIDPGVQAVMRLVPDEDLLPFLPVLVLHAPGGVLHLGEPGEILRQQRCYPDSAGGMVEADVTGSLAGGEGLEPAQLTVPLWCDPAAAPDTSGADRSRVDAPVAGCSAGGAASSAALAVVALLVRRRRGARRALASPAHSLPR